MKRTCEGCKAFDTDGRWVRCTLNFRIEKIYGGVWERNSAKPLEECPKPRTNDRLMELTK